MQKNHHRFWSYTSLILVCLNMDDNHSSNGFQIIPQSKATYHQRGNSRSKINCKDLRDIAPERYTIVSEMGNLDREHHECPRTACVLALILSLTRELSCQTHEARKFACEIRVKVVVAYGGAPINQQVVGYMGEENLGKALEGADVVIIPAGVTRKPGKTCDDLFNINVGILKGLCTAIANYFPHMSTLLP